MIFLVVRSRDCVLVGVGWGVRKLYCNKFIRNFMFRYVRKFSRLRVKLGGFVGIF